MPTVRNGGEYNCCIAVVPRRRDPQCQGKRAVSSRAFALVAPTVGSVLLVSDRYAAIRGPLIACDAAWRTARRGVASQPLPVDPPSACRARCDSGDGIDV